MARNRAIISRKLLKAVVCVGHGQERCSKESSLNGIREHFRDSRGVVGLLPATIAIVPGFTTDAATGDCTSTAAAAKRNMRRVLRHACFESTASLCLAQVVRNV
jgi:hypothetical protein